VTRLLTILVPVLLASFPSAAGHAEVAEADTTEARATVERFYVALLEVMKRGGELPYEERYARLDPVVQQVYDLPFMSAKTLGRHWKGLSEDDRGRWISTFTRLTISTYANRFDEYSGQRFEVLNAQPARYETVMVRTRILPVDEEPVELDYRLRGADGSWRIIDVFMNGTVSELALRRSEYSSVVKRKGFESLVSSLEEKIAAR
jgi:phospholipid transport system substrate-binding protein